MTTLLQIGPIGTGKATIAIAANVGVKWDTTAGNIVVTTTGDQPIGYTQDAIAAGAEGNFYRSMKGIEVLVNGAGIAAGDLVKCTTAGAMVPEAGVTTVTTATVGQAKTASDSNNQFTLTPL
jgi:hypothetical protein